ncbi:MAG TPA: type I DNA topoisomerase [Candidatus Hydrogenedens sp.]|nr:type I DNA topoisomerase [Candidatus Hydrogenedens sp.]HOL19555.1 type I DNA topoisomerase [Candidatus Hydrogenedens sp.]HPP58210.1 type I DNA topoisomerase [Candidatus Hydrogenedens sp.]
MSKYLVVVESPAKARTINKYLGKDYHVVSSFGHIRDLPQERLGVNIKDNFVPEYTILPKSKKIVSQLKKEAEKSEKIIIASDPDREGEAIGWHISEVLRPVKKPVERITFNAITEKAIKEAVSHPRSIDMNLVYAQQARRILDRLVGYKLSPLVQWSVRKGLSAGRVQSVAVRLVCEREEEIRNFVVKEYWTIEGTFVKGENETFTAKLIKVDDKEPELNNEQETETVLSHVREVGTFRVDNIEEKEVRKNPLPPFITSTLQQEASRKLRFAPEYTMRLAQDLYEGVELGEEGAIGLITYMRTDSLRIESEAIAEVRAVIEQKYGVDYLPEKPNYYRSKKGAQDAHEAIRPTSAFRLPEQVKPYLSEDQYKLYNLIWQRFLASQMPPAIYKQRTVEIDGADKKYIFRATDTTPIFSGFTTVYDEERDDTNGDEDNGKQQLPLLAVNDSLQGKDFNGIQHFTKPPARYTEASLIRALEEKGIGRPSTYAPTLKTIRDRGYVVREKGRLKPTPLGEEVNRLLVQLFPDILDYGFTAKMEEELDEIEEGQLEWHQLLEQFYKAFQSDLTEAQKNIVREIFGKDILCEKCGTVLEVREGRYGFFLACPNYPECKFIKSLPKVLTRKTDRDCPACGKPLSLRYNKSGSILLCTGYPDCRAMFTFNEQGELVQIVSQEPVKTDETCPKCGANLVIRKSSKNNEEFYGCENYPKCRFTKPMDLDIPCPRKGCDGKLQYRMSRRGRFLGCSKYPDCNVILNGDIQKHTPCPKCNYPWTLLQKKRGGKKLQVCPNPDCKHQVEVEEDDINEI